MNEEPDLVGAILGSYRILGELGSGGMGTVYRAEHVVIERRVALKVLRNELTAERELVARFVNEAKAASAIRHPGIVDVLDFGYANDGRAYFVMELLEGESLAQRIAVRGRLAEAEAAQIARGIAAALAAAHGKGIVHRDLKPDNVFLVADPDVGERPKVLDFGIAKLGDLGTGTRYTQTGALMGTPLYMAPEQARAASRIDHRADLYSLGCMLYEMLVGEPPFVAIGAGEIIALQLFGTADRPSARGAAVSPALDDLVMRLLAKEPAGRPASAAEVGEALAAVLGERSVPAPPSVAEPRARVWPWVAGATLVASAIIAVIALRGGDAPGPAAPPAREPPTAAVGEATAVPGPGEPPTPSMPADVEAPPAADAAPARPARPPRGDRGYGRDRTGNAVRPAHSKRGSPIEFDLD